MFLPGKEVDGGLGPIHRVMQKRPSRPPLSRKQLDGPKRATCSRVSHSPGSIEMRLIKNVDLPTLDGMNPDEEEDLTDLSGEGGLYDILRRLDAVDGRLVRLDEKIRLEGRRVGMNGVQKDLANQRGRTSIVCILVLHKTRASR